MDGPGRLEVEEVGEEQREGLVVEEEEVERRWGKAVGVCCHEREKEGQRMMMPVGGGQSCGLLLSCWAQ